MTTVATEGQEVAQFAEVPVLNGWPGPGEPSNMKARTAGHTETAIGDDTRADWPEAFALVPSLQVAYV